MTTPIVFGRRALVMAGVLAAAGLPAAAAAGVPRVAALDWGGAASLLALGVTPVGVAEQRLYAEWVRTPALPAGVAELGLRTMPGLEGLAALRPDLILTNPLDAPIRPQLERIAPTLDLGVFTARRAPLAEARAAVRALGGRLGLPDAADRFIADADRALERQAGRLGAERGRSFVPLQIVDGRHVTFYGAGSLFGDVLGALGLGSGYAGRTTQWGSATAEIASLATLPPADLLLVAPLPAGGAAMLDGPSLLTSLVAATGRRLYQLPPAWAFGELTAAVHFATLVADALTSDGVNRLAAPGHPPA